jgi:hypothetical protein
VLEIKPKGAEGKTERETFMNLLKLQDWQLPPVGIR